MPKLSHKNDEPKIDLDLDALVADIGNSEGLKSLTMLPKHEIITPIMIDRAIIDMFKSYKETHKIINDSLKIYTRQINEVTLGMNYMRAISEQIQEATRAPMLKLMQTIQESAFQNLRQVMKDIQPSIAQISPLKIEPTKPDQLIPEYPNESDHQVVALGNALTTSTDVAILLDNDVFLDKLADRMIQKLSSQFAKNEKFLQIKDSRIYCNGCPLDFPDEDALYVKLVKGLIEYSDYYGRCSYEIIDRYFVKNGEKSIENKTKQIKRIHNAIESLGRARQEQIFQFPEESPDGQKVIRINRGKGIIFHNPYCPLPQENNSNKIITGKTNLLNSSSK